LEKSAKALFVMVDISSIQPAMGAATNTPSPGTPVRKRGEAEWVSQSVNKMTNNAHLLYLFFGLEIFIIFLI